MKKQCQLSLIDATNAPLYTFALRIVSSPDYRSKDTVQTQYKHSTNTVQTQYKHSTNTVQTQYKHSTNTVQTQYKHSTNTAVLTVYSVYLITTPSSVDLAHHKSGSFMFRSIVCE